MIHFITPLYRFNNIEIIYSTILNQVDDFNWHLIEGSNKIGDYFLDTLKNDKRVNYYKINTKEIWGHEQRNYFITSIKCDDNDWCYFLDDDNVVTNDIIVTYNEEKNSNTDLVLFSQKHGLTEKTRLLGKEDQLKVGSCDIGSFIIKYDFLKTNLIPNPSFRQADGQFVEILNTFKNDRIFKFYENRYTRYNALNLRIN